MKKLLLAVAVLTLMGTSASAQIYAVGARLGGGQGYNAEASVQWSFLGQRLETDLGWANVAHHRGFCLTGIYQWVNPISDGFVWYAGVGARFDRWHWEKGVRSHDYDFAVALVGQVGVEYTFEFIPLQLSIDLRPNFFLHPDTDLIWGDIALGIRYLF